MSGLTLSRSTVPIVFTEMSGWEDCQSSTELRCGRFFAYAAMAELIRQRVAGGARVSIVELVQRLRSGALHTVSQLTVLLCH